MTSAPSPVDLLTLADPADLVGALAFALLYRGRKRVDTAADAMARITAERLVEHLRLSGYVVLKKPPGTPPSIEYSIPRSRP